MAFVRTIAGFFRNLAAGIVLFFSVNIWLLLGYRDTRLEIKKRRLYDDVMQGTIPAGIGAAVAISFVVLVYLLT
jgi:multicomponent Na+:H+ antiporter subunit D